MKSRKLAVIFFVSVFAASAPAQAFTIDLSAIIDIITQSSECDKDQDRTGGCRPDPS